MSNTIQLDNQVTLNQIIFSVCSKKGINNIEGKCYGPYLNSKINSYGQSLKITYSDINYGSLHKTFLDFLYNNVCKSLDPNSNDLAVSSGLVSNHAINFDCEWLQGKINQNSVAIINDAISDQSFIKQLIQNLNIVLVPNKNKTEYYLRLDGKTKIAYDSFKDPKILLSFASLYCKKIEKTEYNTKNIMSAVFSNSVAIQKYEFGEVSLNIQESSSIKQHSDMIEFKENEAVNSHTQENAAKKLNSNVIEDKNFIEAVKTLMNHSDHSNHLPLLITPLLVLIGTSSAVITTNFLKEYLYTIKTLADPNSVVNIFHGTKETLFFNTLTSGIISIVTFIGILPVNNLLSKSERLDDNTLDVIKNYCPSSQYNLDIQTIKNLNSYDNIPQDCCDNLTDTQVSEIAAELMNLVCTTVTDTSADL